MGGVNGLTVWRIRKAVLALSGAKKNYEIGEYGICLNRCYYAVFYAMQAANSVYRFDSRKHSGVIAFFRQTFIKSGLLATELSDMISYASRYRERADYEDMYEPTGEAAETQLSNARQFVEAVSVYLASLPEDTGNGEV